MKVQHKTSCNGLNYEVVEESPSFYIVKGGREMPYALSKQEWEPVQEWVTEHIYIGDYRATKDGDMLTIERMVKR